MHPTIKLPSNEPITIYGHTSVYQVASTSQMIMLLGLEAIVGVDPLCDDDVKVLAIRDNRERWQEEQYGPHKEAKLVAFGVSRMVPSEPSHDW